MKITIRLNYKSKRLSYTKYIYITEIIGEYGSFNRSVTTDCQKGENSYTSCFDFNVTYREYRQWELITKRHKENKDK